MKKGLFGIAILLAMALGIYLGQPSKPAIQAWVAPAWEPEPEAYIVASTMDSIRAGKLDMSQEEYKSVERHITENVTLKAFLDSAIAGYFTPESDSTHHRNARLNAKDREIAKKDLLRQDRETQKELRQINAR